MKDSILEQTNMGLDGFAFYLKDRDFDPNNLKRKFRWQRPNERTPSAQIKKANTGIYIITDFGFEQKGYNLIDFVMLEFNLPFFQALCKIKDDLNLEIESEINKDISANLKINNNNLSEKTSKYFSSRSISQYTLLRWNITESEESILDKSSGQYKERRCINFNYFDNKDNLLNVKFRDASKNFKLIKNGKLVFYGLNIIAGYKTCIITEGEFDALSYYEAMHDIDDYIPVCSVPNGASKKNNNLKYLDSCWEYFEDKEIIYLALDEDEIGKSLQEELARRFGKHRCCIVKQAEGCKDANETLCKFGKEALLQTIQEATYYPIEGIESKEKLKSDLWNLYEKGYPEVLRIQYTRKFDELYGFRADIGELTVITGVPRHGKSTFISQICTRMAQIHGWKIGVISPETMPPAIHLSKAITQYAGRPIADKSGVERLTPSEYEDAINFVSEHFFMYSVPERGLSVDYILETGKRLVKEKGIKILVIDPWNTLDHDREKHISETDYIGRKLSQIIHFTINYNCHVLVVSHPKKMNTNGGILEVPGLYDIADSANWFNKPDNGITVYRDYETNIVMVYVQKIRQSEFVGKEGVAEFDFNTITQSYKEVGANEFKQTSQTNFQEEPPF